MRLIYTQIDEHLLDFQLALILGNEVSGVDPKILDLCDDVLAIPMQGIKNSFNVATSFGIAVSYLFALSLR